MAGSSSSILTAHQQTILKAIADEKYFTDRYYLTGGTALAEFYLKHRLSEDFDFFNDTEEVNPVRIAHFWNMEGPTLGLVKVEPRHALGLYEYFLYFEDGTKLLLGHQRR